MRYLWGSIISGVAVLYGAGLCAADSLAQPLHFANQSPLAIVYGLPTARGPQVLADKKQELSFTVDFTSHYVSRNKANESLVLDGETTRAAINYRRGFSQGLELRIEVPFIDHSGGFSDGAIDDFHDFTGFSDGGRADGPRDRQLYQYTRNGQTLLQVDDSPSGIGDIRLGVAKVLDLSESLQTSLNAELKLPTGDADKLTGSNSTDLALWLSAGRSDFLFNGFSVVAAAGGLYTGEGDVLADQRQQGVGFGWLTLGYRLFQPLVLKAQLYMHSALYDQSRIDALEGVAVQGGAGLTWAFSKVTALDAAIIEDLNPEASSDVSFNLSLRRGF